AGVVTPSSREFLRPHVESWAHFSRREAVSPATTRPYAVEAMRLAESDAARRHELNRVGRNATLARLEVQVASGGLTGTADPGYLLPRRHRLASVHERSAVDDVTVGGGDSAPVVDTDVVAVAAIHAGVDDGSCMSSVDRSVTAARDVCALME